MGRLYVLDYELWFATRLRYNPYHWGANDALIYEDAYKSIVWC